MPQKLIVVLGPTAVGKTRFAVRLAAKFNGVIISADSRQVYKFMDIGTGKDLNEYEINGIKIPYYLIDFVYPLDEYNLFRFINDFYESFRKITLVNKVPFLVGGTALYINSILKNYNLPKVNFYNSEQRFADKTDDELREILLNKKTYLHNTTDLNNRERLIKAILISEQDNLLNISKVDLKYLVLGVKTERSELKTKIDRRLKYRLENGMIDEAKNLIAMGIGIERLKYFGLEYKYLAEYLEGKLNYNDMYQKLRSAIIDFSKRQMTWFRKMEREGINIHWFSPDETQKAELLINNFLTDDETAC